jgi:hypothetical protein
MHDMASELLPSPDSVVTKEQVHAWFGSHYPRIKRGTIDAHLTRMSTNAASRIHFNGKPGDDDLFLQLDTRRFRLYRASTDPAPIYSKDHVVEQPSEEIEEQELAVQSESTFAFESDLRDYLAKNLHLLEPGLALYDDGERMTGLEFPVGGRFIDILAVDARHNLVVIELKVSRGYDRVVGQLLRYIGWIRQNLANGEQSVRGIIVAREITDDLKLACAELPHVTLHEYVISMSLKRVQ